MMTTQGVERSYSVGPVKIQHFTWTCVSGDVSGTITLTGLSSVVKVDIFGLPAQSALPTYATNVATLAFADPVATIYGTGVAYGR